MSATTAQAKLSFGGLVEETGAAITLLGPGGQRWTLEPVRLTDDVRTITGALPALEPGAYRLEWRVVSADGHPIMGDFVFYVAGGDTAAMAAPPPSEPSDGVDGMASHVGSAGGVVDAPVSLLITRAGADVVLLSLAGLLLFASWGGSVVAPRTGTTAGVLTVLGAALATAYSWLWAGGVLGVAAGLEARIEGLLSLTSGRALAAEVGFVWLASWARLLARRPRVASIFALLAVAVGGGAGHPASYSPLIAMPAAALHLLACAVWVGGLLFLVTELGSPGYGVSARRVSRAALAAVVVVAVTGLVQSWLFLQTVPSPTGSAYERLLLAKIGGFVGLVVFGAYNRKRLVPVADAADGAGRLSRSVRRELVLATGVVILAAILSHIPPTG